MDQPPPIAAATAAAPSPPEAADEVVAASATTAPPDSPAAAAVEELGAPLFEEMVEELTEAVVYNPATKQYESVEFTPTIDDQSKSDEEVEEMVGELMDQSEEPESGVAADLEERTSADAAEEAGALQVSEASETILFHPSLEQQPEEAIGGDGPVEKADVGAAGGCRDDLGSPGSDSDDIVKESNDQAVPQPVHTESLLTDEKVIAERHDQERLLTDSNELLTDSNELLTDSDEMGGRELDLPIEEASEQVLAQPVHEESLITDEKVIAERRDQTTTVEEIGDTRVEEASEAVGTTHSHPSPDWIEESEAPESVADGRAAELDSELPSGSAQELEASTKEQGGAEATDAEEVNTSRHEDTTGEANEMDYENPPAFGQQDQEEGGAPQTDSELPLGSAQEPEPSTEEQGGAKATDAEEVSTSRHEDTMGEANEMDYENPPAFDQQETDAEEVNTSRHEDTTGEANEMDYENPPAFEQQDQEEGGAPHTDSELPLGSAQEPEASTGEQGGAEATDAKEVSTSRHEDTMGEANEMDYEKSPAFEQLGQEEPLPTDTEEVTATQHEETVGEVNETDDEKILNTGTTVLPTALMDESSDSDAKICEEEAGDTDVPLHHSSRVAAANNDAAIDAYLMDAEGEKPMADSPPRSRGRRKRGRPAKAQPTKTPTKTPTKKRKEKEGEEICFICFDGGELAVCNRRGCPKVYHPPCVNRDEALFRAKGRWTCGWHICSNCQKSAHYLCYTCTFSLCKSCIDESGFVLVRDKGFCASCISTIILIEGGKKTDDINFDDESSWMYLFKNYWLDMKQKLSFTLEELTRAKALHEDSDAMSEDLDTANGVERDSSDSSIDRVEVGISSNKKAKKRDRSITNVESSVKDAESEEVSVSEDAAWASKELVEFVSHMKDGDTSPRSQFEVQSLLLDYVKLNKLRAPREKSQVVCDAMLQNLFGRTHVGHFEMLKLLDSHFPVKAPSPVVTDDNQGGVLDPDPSQMDTEGNSDASTIMSSDRRRRMHNKLREKEPQTNLHDYAAIDVHNISLVYMRRSLMEDLIDDMETFSDKVAGAFARIRIPGTGLYRLVQIVGTGKATKTYNTGRKNTDVSLQILNLDKTEFINVDIISNQEFSEEECKRLRQSIKCGFIGRLTVGEIQEKARDLQAVRVKDWLENEKLRLSNLRDRASEQGRRKELRECVEKLQLLSTPAERMRRLKEVPEIHADPKMDPDYESPEDEEDDKKLATPRSDNPDSKRESFFLRRGDDVISSVKGDLDNTWNSARKNNRTSWEPKKNLPEENWRDIGSSTNVGNRPNEFPFHQEELVHQTSTSQVFDNPLAIKFGHSFAIPSASLSTHSLSESVVPSNTNETEKMWHYKDPSQNVQGPFSLAQLQKWNSTGYFPANMGIWRTSERQEDSILLTDALMGKFQKGLPELQTQSNIIPQNAAAVNMIHGKNDSSSWRGRNDYTSTDNYQNFVNWRASHNDAGAANPKDERFGMTSRGRQSNDYSSPRSGQPQGPHNPRAVSQFSGSPYRSPSYNGRGGRGGWNAPESEPIISRNVPAESVNLEVLNNNIIAPSMNSNAWDANTVPASNHQHNSSMTPVNSQPSMSFQGIGTPAGQTALPSNLVQGETLQNSSMILGPAAQTNTNFGWGAVTEGNMSVVWGIPAQGNANLSTTWGTPVQVNQSSNTGWGAPAQGDMSANMVQGAQTQGNINQIATWPVQSTSNLTAHGDLALNPTSGGSTQGSMNQNASWGMPGQGSWNKRLNAEENRSGDWQSERHFQRSNYGNGGGRPSWNRGERSSRPPANGETGICRFHHYGGHCKKGRDCNYLH